MKNLINLSKCFKSKEKPVIIICSEEDIISITEAYIRPSRSGAKKIKLFEKQIIKGVKSEVVCINGKFIVFVDEKDRNALNLFIENEEIINIICGKTKNIFNSFLNLVKKPGSGWGFATPE